MPQLTKKETETLVTLLKKGKTPGEMLSVLQSSRARAGLQGPGSTAIYDFLAGETHKATKKEPRGRPAELTNAMLKVFDDARVKLIKQANNEYPVTWQDVVDQGMKALRVKGLVGRSDPAWNVGWISKQMREKFDVRSRPAKKRIQRTRAEEKAREEKGKQWQKKPNTFWTQDVAYIDSKKFVLARTAKEKTRMKQNRVVSHLRKQGEGRDQGFVAPKKNRILTGIKSFEVTAAVAKNRIIMWHVSSQRWSGAAAAEMYKELGKVLPRAFGVKRKYHVVEDGDPKGFQSGKGIRAKKEAKIESWKLPPRSPEWMPLDFCLWHQIEERLYSNKFKGTETHKAFKKRLRSIAMKLPRKLVKACLASMRKRICMTVAQKGKHIHID